GRGRPGGRATARRRRRLPALRRAGCAPGRGPTAWSRRSRSSPPSAGPRSLGIRAGGASSTPGRPRRPRPGPERGRSHGRAARPGGPALPSRRAAGSAARPSSPRGEDTHAAPRTSAARRRADLSLLARGDRERDGTAVAVAVDRANADLVVVLVQALERVVRDVADLPRVGPQRVLGVAPDDLVAGDVPLRVRVPAQLGVVRQARRDDPGVLRRTRGALERGER